MLVKISCARCKGPLMLNEEHVGRLVRCPTCKNTFTATPPQPEARPGQPVLDMIDAEPVPAAETDPVERQQEPDPAPRPRATEPPRRAAAPPWRPGSRRRYAARFLFPVRVLDDSEDELDGRVDAVANDDGLELREGRHLLLFAPVGTPAKHVGNNEVEVRVAGRRIRLEVAKRGRAARLAHDLAGFLNQERGPLDPDHYQMSRVLLLALLGVPAIAVVVVGAIFLIRALTRDPRIDESAWQDFRPPGASCRLLMPGTPVTRQEFVPDLGQPVILYMVEIPYSNSAFFFLHYRLPDREMGRVPPNQRFDLIRQLDIANPPGTHFVAQRELMLDGHPGREYIVKDLRNTTVISRLYIVDDHDLYVLTARGDNFELDTPDVAKFFDSFKLLDRQPEKPLLQPPPTKEQPLPLVATLKASANRGPPSVTFFPKGDRLLVGRDIYTVNGWIKQRSLGGNSRPSVVALAPNGQTAAVAGALGELELVDVASGQTTKLVQHDGGKRPEKIGALAFSPDGKTLAGHTASSLILWDVATGAKRVTDSNRLAQGKTGGVPVVAFSPDNAHLAASSGDETLILRDPKSGEVQKDLWVDPRTGITSVAFSRDSRKLAWMDSSGEGKVWDLDVLRTSSFLRPSGFRAARVHAVAFASDGRTAAATGLDDRVIFLDVKDFKQRSILRTGHVGSVRSLAFSPDSRLLATTGSDRAVKVWDVSSLTGGVVGR